MSFNRGVVNAEKFVCKGHDVHPAGVTLSTFLVHKLVTLFSMNVWNWT